MSLLKSFKVSALILCLLVSPLVFAKPVGTVTFKTGNPTITHIDNTTSPAEKNTALNAGDSIDTGNGRLQLALIDGGKVSLQPNTIYKINKYEFSGKEDGSEFAFTELIKGGLRTVSGLIGHKNRDRYQLKTAVATIGIRGTEFTVNFNDDLLLMTTNYGSVDVCNQGGCLNAITGQTIIVSGAGSSPKPSNTPAKAAAAAPESSKAVFAVNDSTNASGLPNVIANATNLNGGNGTGTGTGLPSGGLVVSLATSSDSAIVRDEILNATLTFDTNQNLTKVANLSPITNVTPLSFASYNNSDGIIAWGQATGGTYDGPGNSASNNFTMNRYDYVTGITPALGSLVNLVGTYNVFGSTESFLISNGATVTISTPNIVTGNFSFNFSNNTYGYNIFIPTTAYGTFNLTGSSIALDPNYSFTGAGTVSHDLNLCSSSCSGGLSGGNLIQGAFFGNNGERIGLQYGFSVPSLTGTIYGGVVLK